VLSLFNPLRQLQRLLQRRKREPVGVNERQKRSPKIWRGKKKTEGVGTQDSGSGSGSGASHGPRSNSTAASGFSVATVHGATHVHHLQQAIQASGRQPRASAHSEGSAMRSYRECDSVRMPSVTPTREQVPVFCTQLTCFTSTKVQIPQLVAMIASLLSKVGKDEVHDAQVLGLLALL